VPRVIGGRRPAGGIAQNGRRRIAQNGIQVSSSANALVKGDTVSGNWYTPSSHTACSLLFFQARGVKKYANNLFANET
jgi:hypothetical protein